MTEAAPGQTVTVYEIGSLTGVIPIIGASIGCRASSLCTDPGRLLRCRHPTGDPRRIRQTLGGPEQRGREVTIALAGTPAALAVGTPTDALLAAAFGWRLTFIAAVVATCVLVRVLAIVPNSPVRGNTSGPRH